MMGQLDNQRRPNMLRFRIIGVEICVEILCVVEDF